MKVMVIGSGGREHALAWQLARESRVTDIFVAPGNGGTARDRRMQNVELSTPQSLADFALKNGVDVTVVGPEAPLAAGVVDVFRSHGLRVFGVTQKAAQLESSKDFAKAFMVRHGIPTARYETFEDKARAHAYLDKHGAPIVIKADGLAAGKGVVVAETLEQAHAAVDAMLGDGAFGQAGARVVIEEFLSGEEASFIVMCDGTHVLPLASSQDHKRLGDGDQGPNTGGMGAYSPAPIVSDAMHARILTEVITPTIDGMTADGIPFSGFLYAGLMIGPGDDATRSLRVLEYNCRMGDPETQPIMMRIQSGFLDALELAIDGKLDQASLQWDPRSALGVVMAAYNYPETPRNGDAITGLPVDTNDCVVFHAGTKMQDGTVSTSGGRVLCVTALGTSLREARELAYAAVDQIHFDGSQHRRDIGWRALTPTDPADAS